MRQPSSRPIATRASRADGDDSERQRQAPLGARLRTANRVYSGYSWAHRLASWLFSATTAAVITTTGAMTAYDIALPRARLVTLADAEPEEATTQRLGERSRLFSIVGYDHRGRQASFDVIVLDKAYTWVRGSTDQLAEDGRPLPSTALVETILGGPVRAQLAASRGAIAVGVASQEGEVATETRRAGERSQQTARWLQAVLGTGKPLWTLNLGQFRNTNRNYDDGATSWQRPFIVIGIHSAARGIEMGEALADAMRGKSNLASPANYTNFDLQVVEP